MKKLLLLLVVLMGVKGYSQTYKDTTFSVGAFSCSCKYNLNAEDDKGIYDRSAKEAAYPGGEAEWKKFVKKNMDKKFKGKHAVELRFQVDKNGDLSGFTLLNAAPAQKFEEVVRVLKLSGKWFPSVQRGFCIKSDVRLVLEL